MATTLIKMLELSRGSSSGSILPGSIPSSRAQVASTSNNWAGGVLLVGTTAVALPPGIVTAAGWTFLKNSSENPTHVVEYGLLVSSTFYPLGTLRVGFGWCDLGVVALPGNIYLKSNNASTPVDYLINAYAV